MNNSNKSGLSRLYRRVYDFLCGKNPHPRLWHFQYLSVFYLNRSLKRLLPGIVGETVLDVGCGDAPYREWFGRAIRHVGIDVTQGKAVDYVIDGVSPWPIEAKSADIVLCTQVVEHVADLELVINEIDRVLRKGGGLVVSLPFLYNEHGAPHDYRRFSVHGAKNLWPDWRVIEIERQGGIGSTLGLLWLNWFESSMNSAYIFRLLKAPLLPVWMLMSLFVNLLGLLFDNFDVTQSFYSNVLLVLEKPDMT